ncbi:methyltransferase [Aspergillus taichungensis]|uniref:Methyltransferase n=1 Tax=Aspergillus taichungensis TaxID=482145 RepID=A0A2J5HSV7_9EURO|nr:methyltransferase [Aspergillus taichungensis]
MSAESQPQSQAQPQNLEPEPQHLEPQERSPAIIEPDDNQSDNDSTFAGSQNRRRQLHHEYHLQRVQLSNGRRYHSYHEGEYMLPNDEQEQDRMDLSHHIYRMLLSGELCRAPVKNPGRVLDIGTGTGIWAIDYADEHPEAEVIGNDLSPIQPSWIPPNCRFEVDDYEAPWSYSQPFDFIHGRELEGFVRDYDRLFTQALANLKPNGWFEIASIEVTSTSDDGTHHKAKCLMEAVENMHTASETFGKSMKTVSTWKGRMEKAGFVNVHEDIYKLPQSPWPKDPKLKEIGRYHQVNMFEAMGPYTYALFTRVLGWPRERIEALVAGSKNELKDLSNHLYTKVHVVYGQRAAA